MHCRARTYHTWTARAFAALCCASLMGCGVTTQVTCDLDHHNLASITAADIERLRIGVLTPSIVTGRETDKQMIGEVLSNVLETRLGDDNVVSLAELLNRINATELPGSYVRLLEQYETSGILDRRSITRLAEIAAVRYFAKLSLASFEQSQTERFGIAGIRVLSTNRTRLRLFLEIWDSQDGQIVWYANEELTISEEQAADEALSVRQVSTEAIEEIVDALLVGTGSPATATAESLCGAED